MSCRRDFESEVDTIRAALAVVPDDVPMMEAIRGAVVAANHYRADDVPQMRLRMSLIVTEPALSFGAAEHYANWEGADNDLPGTWTLAHRPRIRFRPRRPQGRPRLPPA